MKNVSITCFVIFLLGACGSEVEFNDIQGPHTLDGISDSTMSSAFDESREELTEANKRQSSDDNIVQGGWGSCPCDSCELPKVCRRNYFGQCKCEDRGNTR